MQSVKPNVDRLTFLAVFEMDKNCKYYLENGLENHNTPDKRFTYEAAQKNTLSKKG